MSKKYVGKECVYCGGLSETGDHVIAREFFPVKFRDNLPQVPACQLCNGKKSELEHYLTAVLPAAANHAGERAPLTTMAINRLDRNQRLRRELAGGLSFRWTSRNGGPWVPKFELPFEGHQLTALFSMIVRGLAAHHWDLLFRDKHYLAASFLNEVASQGFEDLMVQENTRTVDVILGEGIFEYKGVQSGADPGLTFWRMSLYGVEMKAPTGHREQALKYAYGVTAPISFGAIDLLKSIMSPPA